MKFKHVISSLVMAGTMAFAAAVGVASKEKVQPAQATFTLSSGDFVYLQAEDVWKKDMAMFYMYMFDSADGDHNTWVRLDYVVDTPLFRGELASGYDKIIFCRMSNEYKGTNPWDYVWNKSADLTIAEATSNVYVITSMGDGKTTPAAGNWAEASHDSTADTFMEEGVSIVMQNEDYAFTGANAVEMDPGDFSSNLAVKTGVSFKIGDRIKTAYANKGMGKYLFEAGTDMGHEMYNYGNRESDGSFTFTVAGEYDVFVSMSYTLDCKFYITEAIERVTVTYNYVMFSQTTDPLIQNVGTDQPGKGSSYVASNSMIDMMVSMYKSMGYAFMGYYTDEACRTKYVTSTINSDLTLYAKFMQTGLYLVGDEAFAGSAAAANNIDYAIQVSTVGISSSNSGEVSFVIPDGASELTPVEIKLLDLNGEGEANAYVHPFGQAYDFASINSTTGVMSFTQPGGYSIYISKENGKIYLSSGSDAFYTHFLRYVSDVCDYDGNTNRDDLLDMWAEAEALYNALTPEEKAKVVALKFDGSGAEDPSSEGARTMYAYNYIVTKYGTSITKDFIFNRSIDGRVSSINVMPIFNNENGSTIVLTVILASLAITAIGAVIILKKRKEN